MLGTLTDTSGMGLGKGDISLDDEPNYRCAVTGLLAGDLSGKNNLNLSECSLTLVEDNSDFPAIFLLIRIQYWQC